MKISQANKAILFLLLGCLTGGFVLGLVIMQSYSHTFKVQAEPLKESDLIVEPTKKPKNLVAQPKAEILPVTILFTGDVMLGRSVNGNILKSQDASWPFVNVRNVMQEADITYINLESPLVSNCPLTDKGMVFCGNIKNVQGLVSSGVDVASVANNHSTNYGKEGLAETIGALNQNGIAVVGTGSPAAIARKGSNFVFLSFNDVGRYAGITPADTSLVTDLIKSAKALGGLVIVGFHWGIEYQTEPNARQISLAHSAIEAGAGLVIGSHPHWVQTKEIFMGRPIYYSLGNFVFDQEWSAETKEGIAVRFTYHGSELLRTDELPVYIQKYGQPQWK